MSKVWIKMSKDDNKVLSVHWTEGECKSSDTYARECFLCYGDEDSCPKKDENTDVFVSIGAENYCSTTESEFLECERNALIKTKLYKQRLFPVELPIVAVPQRLERGNCVRLNLRPDKNGTRDHKIYILDRSVSDQEKGFMFVASVKDMGTYGFALGHTFVGRFPDMSDVVDYALRNVFDLQSSYISWYKDDVLGDYVEISFANRSVCLTSDTSDKLYNTTVRGEKPAPLGRANLAEFVWYRQYGKIYTDVFSGLETFKFEKLCSGEGCVTGDALLDSAIGHGCLSAFRGIGNVYIVFDDKTICNLVRHFNAEDISHVLSKINEINRGENEKALKAIKQGRVKIA